MKKHRLGRSQKYHRLPRHLYALAFEGRACYIGQSVDLHKREQQHRSFRGGWLRPFVMHPLETMVGTQADAEQHEQAWRYLAHRHGWRVYGKPPDVVVNPRRRMGPKSYWLAQRRRWKLGGREPLRWGIWVVLAHLVGLILLMALRSLIA